MPSNLEGQSSSGDLGEIPHGTGLLHAIIVHNLLAIHLVDLFVRDERGV